VNRENKQIKIKTTNKKKKKIEKKKKVQSDFPGGLSSTRLRMMNSGESETSPSLRAISAQDVRNSIRASFHRRLLSHEPMWKTAIVSATASVPCSLRLWGESRDQFNHNNNIIINGVRT
jgi:hypothetical protein